MDFEYKHTSKKYIVVVMIFILIVILGLYFLRPKSPPNISNQSVTPTIAQLTNAPSAVISPTILAPTINYLTPFPNVSIPATGTPDDLMKSQIQSDKNWTDSINDVKKQYPWINEFPVTSDYFFIYFQAGEDKFMGKIYDRSQEDVLKETMKNILKDKGIDTNEFPIEWTYAE